MKISVITVCYNAVATIEDTLLAVRNQSYGEVEHIVIDGGSTDGTVDLIKKHATHLAQWRSEPDKGIYDAMNKGVKLATGDVIGFLNADDVYADHHALDSIARCLTDPNVQACFGDLVYVDPNDMGRIVRYYRSNDFSPKSLAHGLMPAHPTLYVKKEVFAERGLFKTDYLIAADFEFVARLFGKHDVPFRYIPRVMVHMRMGGVSTRSLKSTLILNQEILRACRENEIPTNIFKIYLKYFRKIFQLFQRPA